MLSLQLAHQLKGKNILLVGAGDVAATRIPKLLPTGCRLTVIAPEISDVIWKNSPFKKRSDEVDYTDRNWNPESGKIYRIVNRGFQNEDLICHGDGQSSETSKSKFLGGLEIDVQELSLDQNNSGWHMILTCIPDPQLSERIYRGAKILLGQHILCNVADNPPLCDFYFGSNVILGDKNNKDAKGLQRPIQILISSNGNSPRFTSLLKNEIEQNFGSLPIASGVGKLGQLRYKVRTISERNKPADCTQPKLIKYRMEWIRKCTDAFGVKGCHEIDVDKTSELFSEMFSRLSLDFPSQDKMVAEYSERPP
ncbi:LAMI_0G09098g1_1 [Lachancea mirantina]|uniref:precorrin-2 dehydrogenase n=1 Tax=Lachancea mirantina TaxID=1230905 RepID=A0A1G4KA65_9SACH|nr:LAMI_0G09098g1_1 [Lachancea mirantina]